MKKYGILISVSLLVLSAAILTFPLYEQVLGLSYLRDWYESFFDKYGETDLFVMIGIINISGWLSLLFYRLGFKPLKDEPENLGYIIKDLFYVLLKVYVFLLVFLDLLLLMFSGPPPQFG